MEYTAKTCFRVGIMLSVLSSTLVSLLFNVFVYSPPAKADEPGTAQVIIKKVTYGGQGGETFGFNIRDNMNNYSVGTSITAQLGYWAGFPANVGGATSPTITIPIPLGGTSGDIFTHNYSISESLPSGWTLRYAYCTRRILNPRPGHPEDLIPSLFIFTGQSLSNLNDTSSAVQNPINIEYSQAYPNLILKKDTLTVCTFVNFKDGYVGNPPFLDSPVPWLPAPQLSTLENLASQYFGITNHLPFLVVPSLLIGTEEGPWIIDGAPLCAEESEFMQQALQMVYNAHAHGVVDELQQEFSDHIIIDPYALPAVMPPDEQIIHVPRCPARQGSQSQTGINVAPHVIVFVANAIAAHLLNPNDQLYGAVWTLIPAPEPLSDVGAGDPSVGGADYGMGTIRIIKNTTGGDGTFNFTITSGLSISTQSISTVNGVGSVTFNANSGSLTPSGGTGSSYSIRETVPSGWRLYSVSCTIGSGPNNSTGQVFSNFDGITGVQVSSGFTTTCTFTDNKIY